MSARMYFTSPLGLLEVEATEIGISSLRFVNTRGEESEPGNRHLVECGRQLHEYFAGVRKAFSLQLDLSRESVFHREVYSLVRSIPYGKTRTYSDVAMALGKPGASRAVGQANGHNPMPIIIPCHRVIGKGGGLRGYLYGLQIKQALLSHENPGRYTKQGKLFEQVATKVPVRIS